jgi:NSS family neurotransmitter:Na+ symporter
MLSGFFFAFAVLRYGVTKWRESFINHEDSDVRIGVWWDWAIRLVAVEAVVLFVWWLWGARGADFRSTWTLFSPFNVGSVLIQAGIALTVFLLLNRWLASTVDSNETPLGRG